MLPIVLFILACTICYFFVKINHAYWKKRGVVGPKPSFLVGNLGKSFILKSSPGEIYTEIYRKYKDASVVGLFRSETPVLLVRDPELLKEITTKSFQHFRNNDIDVDKKHDPLFGRNPFVLKGDEWKTVRAQLTPGFTSGKMKWLYSYLETNSKKMVEYILRVPEATNGQGYEAKELCIRYTLNNVGDAVFGIEGKCFEEKNSEFRKLSKEFLSPGSYGIIIMFLATLFPPITKIFPMRFVTKSVEKKLTNLVSDALKHRQVNNIVRNDFLHIISQLKKTNQDFTDVDVTAHAAGFFADGSETSSIVMSFVLFQLSINPDVQSKLRAEVTEAFNNNNNNMPYEVVQDLPYLEAVIQETLRIQPPIHSLQKLCTKSFTWTLKETNKPLVIEEGTPIIIPTHALQSDPQHFEDPESFQPERFLGENRENIKKCTHMPFGEGPRACLGQRFGLLQIKVGLAYIVKNFELSLNKKTKLPLKYDPINPLVTPTGGLWIDFKKIEKKKCNQIKSFHVMYLVIFPNIL
ncbi:probable cytochrome P450 6a13 [Tribolium castaneum]|uniref:Cytochrome P450 347A1 n=1 Tax=Tribolium castaneum TaxID=7070 RepID=D6WN91_TRICA|nr:PREDICTED: probable cytochrome P450 6a13 [Tribolium castaneum]EFA04564.1 cytochrome P450 347A1 [Tribolium castaneum]|eukprot:XP_015835450.1 PREDICTED: probable cytochrome P450 6a13 [Tribolium castaneum]